MPQLTKSQKQLVILGALLAAIVVILAVFLFRPPSVAEEVPYVAPVVDTRIPTDLVERPEYRRLDLSIELPIVPGRMGRENPFEPY